MSVQQMLHDTPSQVNYAAITRLGARSQAKLLPGLVSSPVGASAPVFQLRSEGRGPSWSIQCTCRRKTSFKNRHQWRWFSLNCVVQTELIGVRIALITFLRDLASVSPTLGRAQLSPAGAEKANSRMTPGLCRPLFQRVN